MTDAVIATYQLTGDEFGYKSERDAVFALGKEIKQALESTGVGDFDGDEFGGGTATLYVYGPDADRLFEVLEPILRKFPARPASVEIESDTDSDTNLRATTVQL